MWSHSFIKHSGGPQGLWAGPGLLRINGCGLGSQSSQHRGRLNKWFQTGGLLIRTQRKELLLPPTRMSRVKQITGPGWMHETSARTWCSGRTWRERVGREVGGVSGWGRHVNPRPFHFNVWQNSLQIKKKKNLKKKKECAFEIMPRLWVSTQKHIIYVKSFCYFLICCFLVINLMLIRVASCFLFLEWEALRRDPVSFFILDHPLYKLPSMSLNFFILDRPLYKLCSMPLSFP